jgi:hypothetical protein
LIWQNGVAYLHSVYGSERKDLRDQLGQMCKRHGQPAVLDAIAKTQLKNVPDPLPYMRKLLNGAKGRGPPPDPAEEAALQAGWQEVREDEVRRRGAHAYRR